MVRKKLLILANSVKNEAHCVAGRELVLGGAYYKLGRWLRPVSGHGIGELAISEAVCSDWSPVRVMDFAEVMLRAPVHDPYQPENWPIAGKRCWKKVNDQYDRPDLALLLETPKDLWLDPSGDRTDRVAHDQLERRPPAQSLYVIRPHGLRLEFYTERDSYNGKDKRRRRAVFSYGGVEYDLPLTDPMASDKYCKRIPAADEARVIVPLSGKDGPLVCVSLAAEFEGFHYKILATVIEQCP